MLTLHDIARRACALIGLEDSGTITQAKEFAATRWSMLWDAALWPQSRTVDTGLVLLADTDTVTLPPTLALPTQVRLKVSGLVIPADSELAGALADPDTWRDEYGGDDLSWTLIEPDPATGAARLRLSRRAAHDTALIVLGKRPCPVLLDTTAPGIPGADLCLLAHVQADLYEWMRQLGKSQAKRAEAMALQAQMVDLATAQTGHGARLVPWSE